jgi:DNA uptake protein ComE-like DNA-binding protein
MSKKGGVPENITSFQFQLGHQSKGGRPAGSVSVITPLKKLLKSNCKRIPSLKKIVEQYGVKTIQEALAVKLVAMGFSETPAVQATALNAINTIIERTDGKVDKNINLTTSMELVSEKEQKAYESASVETLEVLNKMREISPEKLLRIKHMVEEEEKAKDD